MNGGELNDLYRVKTDEELLQLANNLHQLTTEAQSLLKAELSKRRIEIPIGRCLQKQNMKSQLPIWSPRATRIQSIQGFVPRVLHLHREHIWLFTKLTTPAVVLTTAAWLIGRYEVHEIAKQMLRRSVSTVLRQRLFLEAAL